jgi:hypothetical protein
MVSPVKRTRGRLAMPLAALALASLPTVAHATDCSPASGISPCFEADPLRVPPAHARFGGIASADVLGAGQSAFSLASTLVLSPLTLNAPSSDPDGREIAVVEREASLIFGLGLGLGRRFELLASLPTSVARAGTGVEGVTAQQGAPLPRTAVRDPRLGLAYSPLAGAGPLALEARLELSLPMGDESRLAGYAGPGVLPALTGELALDRVVLGAEVGARLGQAADFATTRHGSELFLGAGALVGVLSDGLLDVSLELWLRPSLAGAPAAGNNAGSTSGLPAEWLLGAASGDGQAFSVFVGGGSGLPLSRERNGDGRSQAVLAPTAPAFRGLLALRYAPRSAPSEKGAPAGTP